MPMVKGPLISAAVAAALALASVAGPMVLAAGLGIVILLLTLGSAAASGLPAARRVSWVAAAAGIIALVWTAIDGRPDLTPIAATLGPAFIVILVVQLARRDGRPHLIVALTFAVATAALAVMPVMWLALRHAVGGPTAVLFGLMGVCVVSFAEVIPVSRSGRRLVGIVVASVIATAVAVLTEGSSGSVPPVSAVVLTAFGGALTVAAFAAVDRLAADIDHDSQHLTSEPVPSRDQHQVLVTEPPGTRSTGMETAGRESAVDEGPGDSRASGSDSEDDVPAGLADSESLAGLAGLAALAPLRITLPVVVTAPAVYVLGRVFVG